MSHSRSSPSPVTFQGDSSKPVPPFYCAYLLRSTVRHASLYIGSTPNPVRRLAQHNGRIQGGAHRTHKDKLRPWEMVMIVNGFMSRTAALQFEWAWQNTELSRHALDDETTSTQSNARDCPKTGKQTRRFVKSRASLSGTLARLHLLLRSTYFSTWPLEMRFFSEDVYRVWQRSTKAADSFIPDTIPVITDFNLDQCDFDKAAQNALSRLDITNAKSKNYMEKAKFILDTDELVDCGVCHRPLNLDDDFIVLCSHDPCRCASHLLCLSTAFESDDSKLIPMNGTCPGCRARVEWPILMKEVTMRYRNREVNHRQKHHDGSQSSTIEKTPCGGVVREEPLDEVKDVQGNITVDLISSDDDEYTLPKSKYNSTHSDF